MLSRLKIFNYTFYSTKNSENTNHLLYIKASKHTPSLVDGTNYSTYFPSSHTMLLRQTNTIIFAAHTHTRLPSFAHQHKCTPPPTPVHWKQCTSVSGEYLRLWMVRVRSTTTTEKYAWLWFWYGAKPVSSVVS